MDLTTSAAVEALIDYGPAATSLDTVIPQLITSVSGRVATAVARHVETVERTEDVQLYAGERVAQLRGVPISSVSEVLASTDGTFSGDALVEGEDYRVEKATGIVRLLNPNPYLSQEIRVTYTGGMAADTASFVAAYPGLAGAVAMQVANELKRRTNPGGSTTFQGGGMTFDGSLRNLKQLDEEIDAHRLAY